MMSMKAQPSEQSPKRNFPDSGPQSSWTGFTPMPAGNTMMLMTKRIAVCVCVCVCVSV